MYDNQALDTFLGVGGVITQAELPIMRSHQRLGDYAVVYRIYRNKQGGGFGDQNRHPYAWAVLVYVDNIPLRIDSARGACREWSTLDKAGQWLTANYFNYWWTRNDLESANFEQLTLDDMHIPPDIV